MNGQLIQTGGQFERRGSGRDISPANNDIEWVARVTLP